MASRFSTLDNFLRRTLPARAHARPRSLEGLSLSPSPTTPAHHAGRRAYSSFPLLSLLHVLKSWSSYSSSLPPCLPSHMARVHDMMMRSLLAADTKAWRRHRPGLGSSWQHIKNIDPVSTLLPPLSPSLLVQASSVPFFSGVSSLRNPRRQSVSSIHSFLSSWKPVVNIVSLFPVGVQLSVTTPYTPPDNNFN